MKNVKPDNPERDDLTQAEQISNLIALGIFLIVLISYIVKLNKIFQAKQTKKKYTKLHYTIIVLIFFSILSRYLPPNSQEWSTCQTPS